MIKNANSVDLMSATIKVFLSSLKSDQRDKLVFDFNDDNERHDWHYVPRPRRGVSFKELNVEQREMAKAIMSAGLSQSGFNKTAGIMSLEDVLREIEKNPKHVRDPQLYYFTLFGNPDNHKPWGWRLEGHHISLNYTIIDNQHVSSTPSFLGTNPAEVRHGKQKGLRILAAEEDNARSLLMALENEQRSKAIISPNAPADILTGNMRKVNPLQPTGLEAKKMSQKQTDLLVKLLKEYAETMPPDLARKRMDRVQSAGIGNIFFAWAGELDLGKPHYYRVQGPSFLIEYDNTQNNANHAHSVWRDFEGDFGLDLLAMHYKHNHKD
jgi:hypothetical protein